MGDCPADSGPRREEVDDGRKGGRERSRICETRLSVAYLNGGSCVCSIGNLDVCDIGHVPEVVEQILPDSVHGV